MSGIEIVEGVKLLGFLLVVVAIFISTVIIPKRDKEITERKEKIERFDLVLGLLQDFVLRNDIRVILLPKRIVQSSHYYNRKR